MHRLRRHEHVTCGLRYRKPVNPFNDVRLHRDRSRTRARISALLKYLSPREKESARGFVVIYSRVLHPRSTRDIIGIGPRNGGKIQVRSV